jgi:Protein of unknown function (DUF2939).
MRKRMKWMAAAAVAALLVLGALAAASPYLAVRGLLKAAEARDAAGINARVDFPALKQSLKDALDARLEETLRRNPNDPMSALGRLFGPSIVSQLVEAFTTPDNVARLVQGRVPLDALTPALPAAVAPVAPAASAANNATGAAPIAEAAPPAPGPGQGDAVAGGQGGVPSVSMGYEGLGRFVVRVADKKPGAEPLRLEFRREGLLSWKLCAVRLPR